MFKNLHIFLGECTNRFFEFAHLCEKVNLHIKFDSIHVLTLSNLMLIKNKIVGKMDEKSLSSRPHRFGLTLKLM